MSYYKLIPTDGPDKAKAGLRRMNLALLCRGAKVED
jgi:hypothetical protein